MKMSKMASPDINSMYEKVLTEIHARNQIRKFKSL